MLQTLLGWPVVGPVVVLVIGIGFAVLSMTPPRYRIAEVCYCVAAVLLLAKVAAWTITQKAPVAERLFVTFLIFGVVGVGWTEAIRWVESMIPRVAAPEQTPPFSTEVRSALVSDHGPLTLFMVGYRSMFGQTASPVFYLAYTRITNLQDVPSTISEMTVAASQDPSGPWENLAPIPLTSTQLYMLRSNAHPSPKTMLMMHGTSRLATPMTTDDMKRVALITANPQLESQLNSAIPPHQAISGWIAFDSRKRRGLTPGAVYFRFALRDTADRSGTSVAALPIAHPTDSSLDINNGSIQVSGLVADISGFHVRYYSEPYPTPTPPH